MKRLVVCLILCFMFFSIATAAEKKYSPIEAMRIEPLKFNALTGLETEPVLANGNESYLYEYRWFLNGELNLFETSMKFPGELLRRGDKLSVEVTPVSSHGEKLAPFVSLPLEAVNAPPIITSLPPERLDHQGFSYQIEASDPDGDTVIFSLEESPQEMTIDSAEGNINWMFEGQPEGTFPVLVVVVDDFGGRAEQRFELNLSMVQKGTVE